MNQDKLLSLFCRFASEITEKELDGVSAETNIAGRGIDSLQMIEIVGTMERELQIHVADDQLVGIQTVGDLLAVVQEKLAPNAPAAVGAG